MGALATKVSLEVAIQAAFDTSVAFLSRRAASKATAKAEAYKAIGVVAAKYILVKDGAANIQLVADEASAFARAANSSGMQERLTVGFAVGFASFKRSGNLKTAASAVQTVVKSLRATRTESWKIAASVAGRLLASNKVNEPSDCARFVADLVLKELGSAATINLAADAATDAAAFSGNSTIEEVEQAAADAAKAAGAQDQPAVVLAVVKRAAVTAREFGCKTTNRKHLQPPNRDAEGKK